MRIAVVGGSLAGLFVAALAHREGHDVEVYERSFSGLAGRGAGLVAQEEVFTLLRRLGLEHLAGVGVVARERIFLDRAGETVGWNPTPQMQISWDHLYSGVRNVLPDHAYRLGKAVVAAGQDAHQAWIELEGNERIYADIVIGADGIGSLVRASVAGADQHPRYAGYVAWRGLIPESALSARASEAMLDRFAFYTGFQTQALGYLVPGPGGEIEIGSRRYNWVWYTRVNDLDDVLTDAIGQRHAFSLGPGQLDEAAQTALRAEGQTLLPPQFSDALLAEPMPFVQAIFDYETPSMAHGRLALVGDAAFVVRPHTAMGAAKAAANAMALVQEIEAYPAAEALARYDRGQSRLGRGIAAYGRTLGTFME